MIRMFFTVGGSPAGYGYFEVTSVADYNIMPDVVKYLKEQDRNNIGANVSIGTMSIQVDKNCKVVINERAPILVQPDIGLSFDAVGIFSLKFVDDGVKYNLCMSY